MVRKGKIEGRIDPNFYLPSLSVSNKALFKTLNELSSCILHPPEYPREFSVCGVQLIRSQNVRPLGLGLDENPVFFSADFLKDKKHAFAKKGDVLIVRSGVNAGDVAVIENDIHTAIVGADTLLCKCKDGVIPKFLQVYFYTDFGKAQILKHVTGATNKHLNAANVKKVLVPNVAIDVQHKAVSIFEQSLGIKRQKEAKATELLASVDGYLLHALGITLPPPSEKKPFFYTRANKVNGGRFDPAYFDDKFSALRQSIAEGRFNVMPVGKVCVFLSSGKTPAKNEYSDEKTEFPIIKVASYSGDTIDLNKTDYANSPQIHVVEKGDVFVLSAAHQAEYVGRFVKQLDVTPEIPTSFVGELICLRANSSLIDPNYLFALFSSHTFQTLLNCEKRGQTSHIYSNDIKHVQIPLPPLGKQTEIATHIDSLRTQAKQLQQQAESELHTAKRRIEAMLLGENT